MYWVEIMDPIWTLQKNNGSNMDPPKDAHTLIPETCGYVTLQNKGNIADVIKGLDLEKERIVWIIQVGPVSSRVLKSRELS